jgi:predicted O-methyltransferase YrrM
MSKSFQINAYFHYLIHSGNRHSVHSPFVYALLENAIAPQQNFAKSEEIELLRKQLYLDKRIIQVEDFGVGSKKLGEIRQVNQLAKIVGRSKKSGQLLQRLCTYFNPKVIIELGTSIGLGTAYLSSASSNAKVITIEGCKETAKLAFENFHKLSLKNIKQRIGTFSDLLPKVLAEESKIDLVFIDGHHSKKATLANVALCLDHCHNNSLIIIDDIHLTTEMESAWNEIQQMPKVQVSIDLFDLGLIFSRKEQVKQDFILRY